MSKDSHKLQDVKVAVLAVGLSNKAPTSESYESRKQTLIDQLALSGEQLVKEPIPFYKEGVKTPAGYVIETNKEILVCYHGTQFGKLFGSGGKEFLHDLNISSSSMEFEKQKVSVHSGFKAEFEASKNSLYQALAQTNLKEKGVHLSGHSLGGSVAQIAAMDLSTNFGVNISKVTTFGSPRVFTKDAADLYNKVGLGEATLRVKQDRDPVPRIVPRGAYHHVGDKIKLPNPKGIHSGSVYRNIALNKLTDEHIQNKRSSDRPWSFTESYLKPVMEMTKNSFEKLYEKTSPVQGLGSELWHKIKKNPWKTLGTALLATAFPAGTVVAGAIAAGVIAKSGYDSYNNKQAHKANEPISSTVAPTNSPKKQPYSPKISPPPTPNLQKKSRGQDIGGV